MKSPCLSAVALVALTGTTTVESFTTSLPATVVLPSTTQLHLLPTQGKQLEAAWNAALAKAEAERELCDQEEEDECLPPTLDISPKSAARSFVSRVFSLPSTIIRGHPHPKLEGLLEKQHVSSFEWNDHKPDDDVVLFPLVGFQFVNGGQQVLPTKTNAACRLRRDGDEEVVGWFSKVCHLDMYGDKYCDEPSLDL